MSNNYGFTMGKEPILKLIESIRNSNENAEYIYKNGECYNFALILRSMFDGEIYYSRIEGHVWFKYKNKFYDIEGLCLKPPKDLYLLEHRSGHRPHRWNKHHRKIHVLIDTSKKLEIRLENYKEIVKLFKDFKDFQEKVSKLKV